MIPVSEVRLAGSIDAEHEDLLKQLIEQATAALGRELLRYLGPVETFVDVLDVRCCQGRLRVSLQREAIAVSKVETRAGPFSEYEEIAAIEGDRKNWILSGGWDLLSNGGFPAGSGALRVTYTAGYAIGAGPQELQQLVQAMAIGRFREAITPKLQEGLQSESLGDYSYTRFGRSDIVGLDGWQAIARRWKRLLV